MILLVIWVVLMILWLFFGIYTNWKPGEPQGLGNTLIPWICVLILGLEVFGAFGPPRVVVVPAR